MNGTVSFFLALLTMAGVTYLVRLLPLLFVKRKIKNRFIRSFLYYVPYVVLTVMTFPTVLYATGSYVSGGISALVCILLALLGRGMITVALGGALSVFVAECILRFLA